MLKKIIFLLFLVFSQVKATEESPSKALNPKLINLFLQYNKSGQEADQTILSYELEKLGYQPKCRILSEESGPFEKAPINIHIGSIFPKHLNPDGKNWFLPNPEFYNDEIEQLKKIDLILCRKGKNKEQLKYNSLPCLVVLK